MESYTTVEYPSIFEYEDRKSVFIGECVPVSTEGEALAFISYIKKKYSDAKHHVYAYVLRDNSIMRFSDDREPQGTAGMPVLDVIRKNGCTDTVIVVTRYFGGILLGAGGLVRAYTKGAKIAVDAAGKSMKRVWTVLYVPCPYNFYERVKLLAGECEGIIRQTDFGAEVEMEILVAAGDVESFVAKLTDMTAGTVEAMEIGQEYRAFPVTKDENV